MTVHHDIAIVGASLAGASAAIVLGRAGLNVALIDKCRFPRRKPCGEGLSSFGLRQLECLGLLAPVLQLPHLPYAGFHLSTPSNSATIDGPEGITIERSWLDDRLVREALSLPTVHAYFGEPVRDLTPHTIHTDTTRVTVPIILIASGNDRSILQMVSVQERRYGVSRNSASATYAGRFSSEPNNIHIALEPGFEIYATPLANGRLNVSVLVDAGVKESPRDVLLSPSLLHRTFKSLNFEGELALPPMGRTNIGNIRRSAEMHSVYLIGDALEEFDPIGGMGMSHALLSGIVTAREVTRCLQRGECTDSLPPRVRAILARECSALRRFTRFAYHALRTAGDYPRLMPLASTSLSRSVLRVLTANL